MLFQYREKAKTHFWFNGQNHYSDENGVIDTDNKQMIAFLKDNVNYDEVEIVEKTIQIPQKVTKKKEVVKKEAPKADIKPV